MRTKRWIVWIGCGVLSVSALHAETYDRLVRRYEKQIRQQEKQLEGLKKSLQAKEHDAQRWQQKAEEAKAQWADAGASVEQARQKVQSYHAKWSQAHASAETAQWNVVTQTLQGESANHHMAVLVAEAYKDQLAPRFFSDAETSGKMREYVIERLSHFSQWAQGQAEEAQKQEAMWRSQEIRWQNDEQRRSAELDQLRQKQQASWLQWQTTLRRIESLQEEKDELDQSEQALRVMLEEVRQHRDETLALKQQQPLPHRAWTAQKGTLPWPVVGKVVQTFGHQYSADLQQMLVSNGIKIEGAPGRPVRAIEAGKVLFASPFRQYGPLVIVEHKNGLTSVYGGLGQTQVQEGQALSALEPVGVLGDSGSFYFELREDEEPVNPLVMLTPPQSDLTLRRKFQ